MWLKRKNAPCAEIPKLRDEYKRLLKETLSDVRPLQDVAQIARPCGLALEPARVEKTQWQAHQRALRPYAGKGNPQRTGPACMAGHRKRQVEQARSLS